MSSTQSSLIRSRSRSGSALVASVLALVSLSPVHHSATVQAAAGATAVTAGSTNSRALASLAALPLHFEARTDAGQQTFVARGQGYHVAVSSAGARVALVAGDRRATVMFRVDGSTGARQLTGSDRLPGVVNRYVGDRATWQAGLETFGRVVAEHVQPGIDVVYYGNQQQLEYDFVIAAGADVSAAGITVEGADRL